MAYILTLLAVLSVFLLTPPAQQYINTHVRHGMDSTESLVASGKAPLTAKMHSIIGSVREKAMELLREQLHRSIDGLVR